MEEKIEKDLLYQAIRSLTTRAMFDRLTFDWEKLFQKMSSADFMIMVTIVNHPGRLYINDIVKHTQLPMRRVSEIAQALASQGLITWQFEGSGDDGTYVVPTPLGKEATQQQTEILETFYTHVIQQFGKERFKELMKDVGELEAIMAADMQKLEE